MQEKILTPLTMHDKKIVSILKKDGDVIVEIAEIKEPLLRITFDDAIAMQELPIMGDVQVFIQDNLSTNDFALTAKKAAKISDPNWSFEYVLYKFLDDMGGNSALEIFAKGVDIKLTSLGEKAVKSLASNNNNK